MEFKASKYFEMIKFMSMAKCNHVHNWQFKIYDNHSIEIIRDGKVIAQTNLELPSCDTHSAKQIESELLSDQFAKEYDEANKVLVARPKKVWNFKSILGIR